jgi:F0F1-type ATP synthase beta subunit
MCWVHEWAHAYRNIYRAIQHVERARQKMLFRAERYPKQRAKYVEAAERCEKLIKILQSAMKELENLIWSYGIIHKPEVIMKMLTPPKMLPAEEWVKKN